MIWNKIDISVDVFKELIQLFRSIDKINKVAVFGSRARGDNKNTSDIDLCIFSESIDKTDILEKLDNVVTSLKFDVIVYNEIDNNILKKYIDEEGITIYEMEEKFIMMNRFKIRFGEYIKAVEKLQESLKILEPDDLQIDGILQRFEFCTELAWKVLKDYAEIQMIEVKSPKEAIKEGFSLKVIEDGDEWLKMMESRKLTSHSYDEAQSRLIYDKVKSKYIKLLLELKTKLNK